MEQLQRWSCGFDNFDKSKLLELYKCKNEVINLGSARVRPNVADVAGIQGAVPLLSEGGFKYYKSLSFDCASVSLSSEFPLANQRKVDW